MEDKNKRKSVMLILTENCNLACSYCYEHHKTKNNMTFEVAKKIIDDELTKEDGFEEVVFEFFGGEPFLEFELIKKLHNYIFSHEWPKKVLCFATSNGTLVHGKIKEWLKENKDTMYVAVSLDGTKQMHDKNRNNSFDKIDIDFFLESWPNQPCKMTISEETLPNLAEGLFFLQNKGFKVTTSMAQGIEWKKADNLKILEKELKKLSDYYLENPDKPLPDFLDIKLGAVVFKQNRCDKFCGTGEQLIAYDIEGNFYPCQAFAPQTLGKKESEFYKNTRTERFTEGFQDEKCNGCIVYPICRTCYGANNLLCKNYRKRDENQCKFNKLCIMATCYIKYKRYFEIKGIENLSDEELLELKAIQKIQKELDV